MFIDRTHWRCRCGKVLELSPDATRCPCECHRPMVEKAKMLGLFCKVCDFSTFDPNTFSNHFNWSSHKRKLKEGNKNATRIGTR